MRNHDVNLPDFIGDVNLRCTKETSFFLNHFTAKFGQKQLSTKFPNFIL